MPLWNNVNLLTFKQARSNLSDLFYNAILKVNNYIIENNSNGYASYAQPHAAYPSVPSTYTGAAYSGYPQPGQTAVVQPPPPPPQVPPAQHQAPPQYQVQQPPPPPQHHPQLQQPPQQQQAYQLHSAATQQQPLPQATSHSVYQPQAQQQPVQAAPAHSAYQAQQTPPQQPQPPPPPQQPQQPPQPPPQQPPPSQTFQSYNAQIAKARPQQISVPAVSQVSHSSIPTQQAPPAFNYTQNTTYSVVTATTRTTIGNEYRPLLKSQYYPSTDTSSGVKDLSQTEVYHASSQQPSLQAQASQPAVQYQYQEQINESRYQYKDTANKTVYQAPYSDATLKNQYQISPKPPAPYQATNKAPSQYQAAAAAAAAAAKLPTQYQSNVKPTNQYQQSNKLAVSYPTSTKPPSSYQAISKIPSQYTAVSKTVTQYQSGTKPQTQYQNTTTKSQVSYPPAAKIPTQYQGKVKSSTHYQNQNSTKPAIQYQIASKTQTTYQTGATPQYQARGNLTKPAYQANLSKPSYQSNSKSHFQSPYQEANTKPQYQYRKPSATESHYDQYQESHQLHQSHYQYQQINSTHAIDSLSKPVDRQVPKGRIQNLPEADTTNGSQSVNADSALDSTKNVDTSSAVTSSTPISATADSSSASPKSLLKESSTSEIPAENSLLDAVSSNFEPKLAADDENRRKKNIENGENESPAMKILKELMQPMLCKLCNVAMNAAIQSDQHYNGKNHAKKVRLFMLSGGTQLPATKNRPAVEYKPGQEILVLTNSGSINGEDILADDSYTILLIVIDSNLACIVSCFRHMVSTSHKNDETLIFVAPEWDLM
ncbi:uncharacterized protein LOC106878865 [Octopus bimaculoides]|nr:uncharacterized protein LOC106878865 [Octopus bimaculoides]